MALALSKRDPDLALPGHPSPRQDLEAEVDALFERVVVLGLWDPPNLNMQCFMTNLLTGELQAYPEGWWEQVAEAIDPSVEQKAALKLVWQRVKQQSVVLGQEYDGLQQRLQQLHESLRAESSSFDRMLQALSELHVAPYAEQRACQPPQPPTQQGGSSSVQDNSTPPSSGSVPPVQLGAGGCFFAPGSGACSGQLRESEELLLQGGVDQRGLEAGMVACFNKIRVLTYCLVLQMANTLSKTQLATMCVQSHPFLFDALGICEALDSLGWFEGG